MTGPLPPNYTCYRCGKPGHWIKNCPTNTLDIKRSTGIPRSFMVPVDGPEHKGALLTSSGDFAVPLIDHQAYKEVKKEKPPFLKEPDMPAEPERPLPEELLCMVCNDLLQDAVLIPCCGNSFCDECVRQVLLDSENHECPMCHELDISPDNLIPNRYLRTAVLNFKNETGYTRMKRFYQVAQQQTEIVAATELPVEMPASAEKLPPVERPPLLERPPPVERPPPIEEPPPEAPEPVAQPPQEPEPEVPIPVEADSTVVDDDGRSGTPLADEPPVEFEAAVERHGNSACNSPSNSVHYGADVLPPGEQPIGHAPEHSIMTITTRGPDYMNCGPSRSFTKEPPIRSCRPNVSKQILGPSSHHSRSSRDDPPTHRLSPPHHKSLHRISRYPGSVSQSRAAYSHSTHSLSRFGPNNRPAPSNPVPPPIIPMRHGILPPPFPPQPPPPGASPHSHAPPVPAQPPPPGVGPVHPVVSLPSHTPFPRGDYPPHVPSFPRDTAFHGPRDRNWTGSRDTYDDITRKFLDYQCNQNRRPRRRSSRSRSRSYRSSKSRSTSPRWSRSRSSSFSRSRSYSRSRSASRSYSRSRSRSRSYHRSRSRSPARHRKNRSPRRYYRSKSRSPRKYTRPPPHYSHPHPHSSRMDYPADYFGISAPPYSSSIPPSQPPTHFKGSRPGGFYHEPFSDYDTYPSRYDSGNAGYGSRFGQSCYPDSRKAHGREWDPQYGSSSSWKDSHGKRTETPAAGTTTDKPKEHSDSDSAKKKDKLKQKKHHHHHRHKESKKGSKSVEVTKEKKATADRHNPSSTGSEKVKKEGRIVSLSKDKLTIEQVEVLQKDKKHKHKKGKESESSKKRKKKSSSEDAVHGSETEKSRKRKRKTNPAVDNQNNEQYKEVPANEKIPEEHKNPDNPASVDETNLEEGASSLLDGAPLEASPAIESHTTAVESLQEGHSANSNPNTSTESTNILANESALPEEEENITGSSKEEEEEEAEEGEIGDDEDDGSVGEDKLNELQVQMPEISKWEREDYDSAGESQPAPDSKPELDEGKTTLSSDIIQKAEKALLHKALKSAIVENPSRKRQVEDEKTSNSGSRQKSDKASSDKERSKVQDKFGLGTFHKLQRNVTIKFGEIRHLKGMPNKRSVFVEPAETKKSREDDSQKSETQVKKIKDEPVTRSEAASTKRNSKKQDSNPGEKVKHGSISKRDDKGEHKRADSKERAGHSLHRIVEIKKEPKENPPVQSSSNKHISQEGRLPSTKSTTRSDERACKEKLDEDDSVRNITVTTQEASSRNPSSSKKLDGNKASSSADKTGKSSGKTKDSTEDESKFEPNYDETSDSDSGAEHDGTHVSKKRKLTSEDGRSSKRLKGEENDSEMGKKSIDEGMTSSRSREKLSEHRHQRSSRSRGDSGQTLGSKSYERKKQQSREVIQSYVVAQRKRTDSVSSEASSSSSSDDSDSSSVKKKVQSESTDSDQKQRLKKSKHRRHKKRKHKHKKKRSHRIREKDEVRLSSSIVRR